MSKMVLTLILIAVSFLLGGIFSDFNMIATAWALRIIAVIFIAVALFMYLDSGGKK